VPQKRIYTRVCVTEPLRYDAPAQRLAEPQRSQPPTLQSAGSSAAKGQQGEHVAADITKFGSLGPVRHAHLTSGTACDVDCRCHALSVRRNLGACETVAQSRHVTACSSGSCRRAAAAVACTLSRGLWQRAARVGHRASRRRRVSVGDKPAGRALRLPVWTLHSSGVRRVPVAGASGARVSQRLASEQPGVAALTTRPAVRCLR